MSELEQILDMPHVFSRRKVATEKQYSMEDLRARSQALAQKKVDAAGGLNITKENAEQYAEIAAAIEEVASKIEKKFKGFPCNASPSTKGTRQLITIDYDQSLEEFCSLNGQIYEIITDAKHVMNSMCNISKSLPKVDLKAQKDVQMFEFVNALS
jgi:hypothetical protein